VGNTVSELLNAIKFLQGGACSPGAPLLITDGWGQPSLPKNLPPTGLFLGCSRKCVFIRNQLDGYGSDMNEIFSTTRSAPLEKPNTTGRPPRGYRTHRTRNKEWRMRRGCRCDDQRLKTPPAPTVSRQRKPAGHNTNNQISKNNNASLTIRGKIKLLAIRVHSRFFHLVSRVIVNINRNNSH
jgi:hypothetical protein